jgi:hypothetical protein
MVEIDECASGPELATKLLSRHDLSWLLQQYGQQLKWLILEFYSQPASAQFSLIKVRFKHAEADNSMDGNLVGHLSLPRESLTSHDRPECCCYFFVEPTESKGFSR